ncbi:Fur-regulated basic protein FbpA [Cytobacillus horneckiae]|uniref:Fur-regulated basic protein FbpA n=1 Tax=Cytobacillus horneckiae TaxID=549687 RepID=UPI003D9A3B64
MAKILQTAVEKRKAFLITYLLEANASEYDLEQLTGLTLSQLEEEYRDIKETFND